MLLKWWTVYFKSHKLSYSCEKYYGPKPFCPPESSSMTPNDSWGSVWETLPQSPRHHCCEKSTPNPQRYQFFHFISHHPILPAYKIPPIPHPRFPVHHQLWPFLPLECWSVSSSLPPWNATVMHQGCIPLHYSGIFLALLSAASLSCVEFSHLLSCWPPKQCVALVNPSFIRLSLEASAGHSPLSITSDTFPARKLHTQILSSLLWGGCALELPPLPGCPHCSPFL